ncbi:MAG: hypothetical protein LBT59_22440 [Clostridiales bacterium]|jgi:hypothetical protein|nr:hypothetical protein [Clostridiales bacterium]
MRLLVLAEWFKLKHDSRFKIIALTCLLLEGILIQGNYIQKTDMLLQEAPNGYVGSSTTFWQIALLAAISFFCASDFITGAIRNPISIGQTRVGIYLSRLIAAMIMTAALLGLLALAGGIAMFFINGTGSESLWAGILAWGIALGKQIVLHLAYPAAFLMIAFITRSPAMSLLISFLFIIALMLAPYAVSILLPNLFPLFVQALPDSHIQRLGTENENFIYGLAVCGGWFAVTSIVGCALFARTDIK